jgi:hypothetical protein
VPPSRLPDAECLMPLFIHVTPAPDARTRHTLSTLPSPRRRGSSQASARSVFESVLSTCNRAGFDAPTRFTARRAVDPGSLPTAARIPQRLRPLLTGVFHPGLIRPDAYVPHAQLRIQIIRIGRCKQLTDVADLRPDFQTQLYHRQKRFGIAHCVVDRIVCVTCLAEVFEIF